MESTSEKIILGLFLLLVAIGTVLPVVALCIMTVHALIGAWSWLWPVGYLILGTVVAVMGLLGVGDKIVEQGIVVAILVVLGLTILHGMLERLPPMTDEPSVFWWSVTLMGVIMTPSAFFLPTSLQSGRPSPGPDPAGRQQGRLDT